MDFGRSHFGKMQLWIVQHFHLRKKVPVVMNHNMWFFSNVMIHYYRYLFCEDESVQLFRVAFFQRDFLQNPYFSITVRLQTMKFWMIPYDKYTWEGQIFILRFITCLSHLDPGLADLAWKNLGFLWHFTSDCGWDHF